MSSLRTFIADRRAQIEREIATLRVELEDLNRAEAALADVPPVTSASRAPKTLKGMAIETLRSHSRVGLSAGQILQGIERKFDVKIERSSLSPQLSRLKKEGILTLEGKNWRRIGALEQEAAYLEPSEKNEPSGDTPDGSETRSNDSYELSQELINKSQADT